MTDAWMTPEGGSEDPERPTAILDASMPVVSTRDAQTDARTISEAEGGMSDELDMAGYQIVTNVQDLADEKRRMGWIKIASPFGGTPAPANTSGTRGADDIGKI
jgi:hypothetical protein